MRETRVDNAEITSTVLGREGYGIFTCELWLKFNSGGCGYGGYSLDEPAGNGKRKMTAIGAQAVVELMNVVGVETWEDVKGQFVRCENEGYGGKVIKIGHLIENKWFSFEEFFKEAKAG